MNAEGKSMPTIRPYQESDAQSVGVLIADTYSEYNLSEQSSEQRSLFVRPLVRAIPL
jgi:hypothetical protein